MFEKILFFGFGAMASAVLEGWLASGLEPARFTVYNPRPKPVPQGVAFTAAPPPQAFDTVVLGVKPQSLAAASDEVARLLGPDTVLVSLLAGVPTDSLGERFPDAGAIARMMPNLAAALGKSPVALVARGLNGAQRAALTDLAQRLGRAEWLEEEWLMDLVGALSASGHAFVDRFIAALARGAADLGLDPAMAQRLTTQMVAGAATLAERSAQPPGELARRVASPGGTTQSGLDVLDAENALQGLVTRCLAATRDRGRALAAPDARE